MTVRELKQGEFFTLRPVSAPKDNQVYIRGEYDRTEKKYCCGRCDDINYFRMLKADTEIFTDFIY